MALTLHEAKKLAVTPLQVFVINEFLQSQLMGMLPFVDIEGNAYSYNKVDTLPGIGFRGLNESYTESTGIINPQTESLKILGGDMDVDKFITQTQGGATRQQHIQLKLAAARLKFEKTFIKGDELSNPKEFDGLQKRITGNQRIDNVDDTGNGLSLNSLDRMLARVKGPAGNKIIISNQNIALRMTAASRNTSVGGHIQYDQDEFGNMVTRYQGIRWVTLEEDELGNDILPFTEASGDGTSSANNTSIYCVSMDPMGVTGLQNGVLQTTDLGEVPDKPVLRTRLDWYVTIAILNGRSAARLQGIQDLPVTI